MQKPHTKTRKPRPNTLRTQLVLQMHYYRGCTGVVTADCHIWIVAKPLPRGKKSAESYEGRSGKKHVFVCPSLERYPLSDMYSLSYLKKRSMDTGTTHSQPQGILDLANPFPRIENRFAAQQSAPASVLTQQQSRVYVYMVWLDDMCGGACRRPSTIWASALAHCLLWRLLPPLLFCVVLLDFGFKVNGQTEIQETFCNGRGMINSNLTCSCFSGFRGPDCSLSEYRHPANNYRIDDCCVFQFWRRSACS